MSSLARPLAPKKGVLSRRLALLLMHSTDSSMHNWRRCEACRGRKVFSPDEVRRKGVSSHVHNIVFFITATRGPIIQVRVGSVSAAQNAPLLELHCQLFWAPDPSGNCSFEYQCLGQRGSCGALIHQEGGSASRAASAPAACAAAMRQASGRGSTPPGRRRRNNSARLVDRR